MEEGLKCLHDGDYQCAIDQYNQMPDVPLKKQKLCTTLLAKAGLTLDAFMHVITQSSGTMLGNLAVTLMPWNSTKAADADSAYSYCENFFDGGSDAELGILLLTVSSFVDCSLRMARTDIEIGSSNADTACNTPGNRNEVLEQSDVAADSLGATPGMCPADVSKCQVRMKKLSDNSAALSTAGLTELAAAFSAMPDDLKSGSATTDAARAALRSTVSP